MADRSAREQIAAGLLHSEQAHGELLRSIVEVARGIFEAQASSVMLLDEASDELVFEAVVGEGEATLIGQRIPAGTGIAGWVLQARQPLVIEDVAKDPRFARDVAEDTGYVPKGLMSAPLLRGERAIGVLSVLDRPTDARFSVAEMDLLLLFATQAAIALDLLQRARNAKHALEDEGADRGPLSELASAVEGLSDERAEAAHDLLGALTRLLDDEPAIPRVRRADD